MTPKFNKHLNEDATTMNSHTSVCVTNNNVSENSTSR